MEIRVPEEAGEEKGEWGLPRALQAEVSPGVGATSLPAAPLGRAVQEGMASE